MSLALSLPAVTWAVDDVLTPLEEIPSIEEVNENTTETNISDDVLNNEEAQIQENDSESSSFAYKKPISKKALLKKFLLAMFCVGIVSILLYVGLNIYQKTRENTPPEVKTPEGETPLSVPNDIESATKIFLDKTKW